MNYYWHVITTPTQWETLTKQTDTYPESFPVLAGCVALSDTEFVVCPLPVAEIPNLLAGLRTNEVELRYHDGEGDFPHRPVAEATTKALGLAKEETVTQNVQLQPSFRNAAFPLTNPPDGEETNREG